MFVITCRYEIAIIWQPRWGGSNQDGEAATNDRETTIKVQRGVPIKYTCMRYRKYIMITTLEMVPLARKLHFSTVLLALRE
jgi:hypothetical protein